jgi:hypothetical protein
MIERFPVPNSCNAAQLNRQALRAVSCAANVALTQKKSGAMVYLVYDQNGSACFFVVPEDESLPSDTPDGEVYLWVAPGERWPSASWDDDSSECHTVVNNP